MLWLAALIGLFLTGSAGAQDSGAYRIGLRVAESRGYQNADCYARVFAKHAVVVESPDGRRGWRAASTPAYNAEQRARCGVDRLQDLAARREARADGAGSVPYRIGLGLAAQRNFFGASGACFARLFAAHASQQPSPDRRIRYGISGAGEQVFAREVQRSCGLIY